MSIKHKDTNSVELDLPRISFAGVLHGKDVLLPEGGVVIKVDLSIKADHFILIGQTKGVHLGSGRSVQTFQKHERFLNLLEA